jgi:hypothetical protein
MTLTDRWLALGDRLYNKGKAIFDHSDVLESEAGTKDPKVVALTLLARTMGNFAGAVLLLKDHHVVEARTLARCCYENLFWIAALSKKGDEFIRSMELDDAASRMKRATGLLDWTKQQAQCFDFAESLGKFRDDMKERHGKPGGISQWDAADAGGVGPAYIIYRELSGDSAHPSATSLSRHVTWNGEGKDASFTVRAVPVQEPLDIPDTLELACNPLLGICVAANQILGGVDAGESLEDLFVAFRELSDANKTARDARELPKA